MKRASTLAVALALLASPCMGACGYRIIQGDRVLTQRRVYLAPLLEDGTDFGLAGLIHQELRAAFMRRGVELTNTRRTAELLIEGSVTGLTMRPSLSAYNADSAPSYSLSGRARFAVRDASGKEIWKSSNIRVSQLLLAGRGLGASQLNLLATEANRRRALSQASSQVAKELLRQLDLAALTGAS